MQILLKLPDDLATELNLRAGRIGPGMRNSLLCAAVRMAIFDANSGPSEPRSRWWAWARWERSRAVEKQIARGAPQPERTIAEALADYEAMEREWHANNERIMADIERRDAEQLARKAKGRKQ